LTDLEKEYLELKLGGPQLTEKEKLISDIQEELAKIHNTLIDKYIGEPINDNLIKIIAKQVEESIYYNIGSGYKVNIDASKTSWTGKLNITVTHPVALDSIVVNAQLPTAEKVIVEKEYIKPLSRFELIILSNDS
jgi:hypothetical protein